MIIEDNDDIRENIVEILELANFKVFAAANGRSGLALAAAHLPDIILCDIMMPELNGYEVLTNLRNELAIRLTPFLFLTARSENFDLRKGVDSGADGYLVKPFDDEELIHAINRALKIEI